MVSSKVNPLQIEEADEKVRIKVLQVIHNLYGNLLADDTAVHLFGMLGDKICKFEIMKEI
jgi:hypothetical protein